MSLLERDNAKPRKWKPGPMLVLTRCSDCHLAFIGPAPADAPPCPDCGSRTSTIRFYIHNTGNNEYAVNRFELDLLVGQMNVGRKRRGGK